MTDLRPETRARALLEHPAVRARLARSQRFKSARTPTTLASRKTFLEAYDDVLACAMLSPRMSLAYRPDPGAPSPRIAAIARLRDLAKIDEGDLADRARRIAEAEDRVLDQATQFMCQLLESLPRRPKPPPVRCSRSLDGVSAQVAGDLAAMSGVDGRKLTDDLRPLTEEALAS